jgi:hypothetical protein
VHMSPRVTTCLRTCTDRVVIVEADDLKFIVGRRGINRPRNSLAGAAADSTGADAFASLDGPALGQANPSRRERQPLASVVCRC